MRHLPTILFVGAAVALTLCSARPENTRVLNAEADADLQNEQAQQQSSLLGRLFSRLVQKRTLREQGTDPLDIYRTPGCPFSSWFFSLPDRFGTWEDELVEKYDLAWRGKCQQPDKLPDDPNDPSYNPNVAGCPLGFDKNDHNYNTALGQGNSIGLLTGYLEIYNMTETGNPDIAVGLFNQPGKYPVIGRGSDFGDDSSSIRLTRFALKIPYAGINQDMPLNCTGPEAANTTLYAGSWYGEMNMLLTETMDTFPLADYDDVAKFANDPASGTWSTLVMSFHVLEVLVRNGWDLYKTADYGILAKRFYSMLPYMLGCGKAFKFSFFPLQDPCSSSDELPRAGACCVPSSGNSRAELVNGLNTYIQNCDASFEMRVQVLDTASNWDLINTQAQNRWSSPYITVGRLTFPAQNTTSHDGMSSALRDALAQELSMNATDANIDGLHKLLMFHPLLTPNEHRPLGQVNSFRSHFYSKHAGERLETMQWNAAHPTPIPDPPFKVPDSVWNNTALFGL